MPLDATWIAPKLWIGSQAQPGPHMRAAGFDFLVLCAQEWQPPARVFPGVRVHHAPFDDSVEGLTPREEKIAHAAARKVISRLRRGQRCLVTCWAGRNRSGLVTALALAGVSHMTPAQAGDRVQRLRHNALSNERFMEHLRGVRVERPGTCCELCDALPLTRRHHEGRDFWIADCKDCHVPMAVYRRHGVVPSPRVLTRMRESLLEVANKLTPGCAVMLTDDMRTHPTHYHMHVRSPALELQGKRRAVGSEQTHATA